MVELVGTNTLKDCDPNPARNAVYTGVSGVNGIVADCGMTYAPDYGTLGALVVTGGGHADYGGNEVYVFPFDTMTWVRLTEPSTAIQPLVFNTPGTNVPIGCDLVHGEHSDGTPLSNHNYSSLQAIPGGNKGLLLSYTKNNICWTGQESSPWSHVCDLETGVWSRYSVNAAPHRWDNIAADATCYDASRGRVWGVNRGGSGIISYLDLASKTHSAALGYAVNGGYLATCARTPVNDLMLLCSAIYSETVGAPTQLYAVDLKSPGSGIKYLALFGDVLPSVRYCPVGFDWDTANNVGWIYFGNWTWGETDGINDTTHVYRVTPPISGSWITGTWSISKVALPSALPDCVNGPYSRWRYCSKISKFALVSKAGNKVALWTPPSGSGGDTIAPAKPIVALNAIIAWSVPMYNVLLHGTAGPESDIAKVRIYKNGVLASEQAVAPLATFNFTMMSAGAETLSIGHSFVDGAGNESAQLVQTVVVPAAPDLTAPGAPKTPMTLVSVVWVP